jgi:2-polyprenyl-3-methyl-5-hydroxy-6-metoxy-1,4-benzoquinol methylase
VRSVPSSLRPVDDWREAVWTAVPEGAEPERFAERRDFLLRHVTAGDRVLDLGCGDGAFAAALVDAGAVVTGVDVAAEALRRARARAPQAQFEQVAEGAALPLAEDAFDVVWAGEVLEHVADVVGLLGEARRVLRWGGTLLVTTPNVPRLGLALEALRGAPLEHRLDPRVDHLRFFTARTLTSVLRDAGFTDVQARAHGGPPGARRALSAVAR